MKVRELIELLEKYPQDIEVCYDLFSDRCLLEARQIELIEACAPRNDGWLQNRRPDKPTVTYLCFPGN